MARAEIWRTCAANKWPSLSSQMTRYRVRLVRPRGIRMAACHSYHAWVSQPADRSAVCVGNCGRPLASGNNPAADMRAIKEFRSSNRVYLCGAETTIVSFESWRRAWRCLCQSLDRLGQGWKVTCVKHSERGDTFVEGTIWIKTIPRKDWVNYCRSKIKVRIVLLLFLLTSRRLRSRVLVILTRRDFCSSHHQSWLKIRWYNSSLWYWVVVLRYDVAGTTGDYADHKPFLSGKRHTKIRSFFVQQVSISA